MKQFWTFILIAFIYEGSCLAQSQDRTIHQRTVDQSSAMENDVFQLVYDNPAMKSLQHNTTLTTLQAGGTYQKQDLPFLVQEGKGIRMGETEVNSFIRKKNSALWGKAHYSNGKQLGKCWNETSDFSLLYPYVIGDTIGGDLKSEQYFFSGGYAYHFDKYIISAEGAYEAKIEYRNADPRPKNLTGDLNVKIGVARALSSQYWLGIAGYARKYKQTNDLAFYNELGVPVIYHFTGLGTDYYRFRGAKGESFYKGHAFGASMELHPATQKGFSAGIQYQNFQFDKVISSLNELPMASVKEDQLKTEIAWKNAERQSWNTGVRGGFNYTRRTGSENLFGEVSGNIFPQISSQKKYMNKIYDAEAAGVLEYATSKGIRYSLIGQAHYTQIRTTHLYPQKEMKVAFTTAKVDFRVACPYRKWLFTGETGFQGRFNAEAHLDLQQDSETGNVLSHPVRSNFGALKANLGGGHLQLRTDYSWNQKYSIYLAARYQYLKDNRPSTFHYVSGQLGFTF